jgi:hypothetical protein
MAIDILLSCISTNLKSNMYFVQRVGIHSIPVSFINVPVKPGSDLNKKGRFVSQLINFHLSFTLFYFEFLQLPKI